MNCPKCNSDDVIVRTETSKREKLQIGFFWMRKGASVETKTTHRCLDCGHEWEGGE